MGYNCCHINLTGFPIVYYNTSNQVNNYISYISFAEIRNKFNNQTILCSLSDTVNRMEKNVQKKMETVIYA